MSAITAEDCSCDLIANGHAFPGLAVQQFTNETKACVAWLTGDRRFEQSKLIEMAPIARYYCVHLRERHVIGVRP